MLKKLMLNGSVTCITGLQDLLELTPPPKDILFNIGDWNATVDFPGGSYGKASAYSAGNLGSIPELERSGEGNANTLQYYCLENPVDGGPWWAAIYGATQSRTRLK